MELDDFKRKRPSFWGYFTAGILGAVTGSFLLLAFGPAALFSRFEGNTADNAALPIQQIRQQIRQTEEFEQVRQIISEGEDSASAAAEKVLASVVGITTTSIQRDEYFRSKRVQGVGSGVIVDERGYILTNNHVTGGDRKSVV